MIKKQTSKIVRFLIAALLCTAMLSGCAQHPVADQQEDIVAEHLTADSIRFEHISEYDEEQDLHVERAIIMGMKADGSVLWTHLTGEYPRSQSARIEEVIQWENQYIYCENGVLIALDTANGAKLWENDDFNGCGIKCLKGKNGNLYLCAYQGPAFFELDKAGNTVYEIETFEGYDWACDIQPAGDKIAVTMELSISGEYQEGGHIFYVDPTDYSYELQNAPEKRTAAAPNQNYMMKDSVSVDSGAFDEDELYVFGSTIPRKSVRSITFLDTLSKVPEGHGTDISENKDNSVVAWMQLEPGFELLDLYIAANGDILAPRDCTGLFAGYQNLEEINFNNCFDTSEVRFMSGMFMNCDSLKSLDVSGFDTSNVYSMEGMFCKVSSVEKLDLSSFNTENVSNMNQMFSCMGSLKELDVSSFNTEQVMFMEGMFDYCTQLKHLDLSSFETGYVISMGSMFYRCMNLETVDVSSFDVSVVMDMSFMFSGCSNLKELDLRHFNTKNACSMESMFEECQSLTALDLSSFDTSLVSKMGFMFYRCNNLKYLDISSFDFSNFPEVEIPRMIFSGDYADINIKWPEGMNMKTHW